MLGLTLVNVGRVGFQEVSGFPEDCLGGRILPG